MDLQEHLKNQIETAVENSKVFILDPREDGRHLEAIVISDSFINLPLIERHQIVMNSIKEFFNNGLHALSIKTYTEAQYDEVNNG